ncbi:MAG: hypothetical protein MUE95_02975 [Cyclobacteriaceae bacterium]|nr:hypothetical protein [Cyclobacteriaceae bacterium]
MRAVIVLMSVLLLAAVESHAQKKVKVKKSIYEEVDLEQMIKRYFGKEMTTFSTIEGIYSVSCVITKTANNFLTGQPVTKVIARKDNYARVAILKDWPGSKREFIEVSMSFHQTNKYPIVGEFQTMLEGGGYLYKHTEPDGTILPFTMLYDHTQLIEGSYTLSNRRKIISYKLSYLKIYPKAQELNVVR